jgi:DNA-binding GntR family transcriptional regulator
MAQSDGGSSETAGGAGKRPVGTKRDQIASEIRRMVSVGDLPRGRPVRQDALAELFSTSITPVREALRVLEAEGVLIGEPHRGVRVADADYGQVKSVYLTRRLIEPYAMQRAARRMSAIDMDAAAALTGEMEEAATAKNRVRLNELNYRFHFTFYDRCGNSGLAEDIVRLWRHFPWDVLPVLDDRGEAAAKEHREMMGAMRRGDLAEIERTTGIHLRNSFLALGRHLTGQDVADPFELDND